MFKIVNKTGLKIEDERALLALAEGLLENDITSWTYYISHQPVSMTLNIYPIHIEIILDKQYDRR